MKNLSILLGIVLLMCLLLMCYSKTESIDDVKEPQDLTVSTIPTSEPYTGLRTESYTISEDEILLLTINIDSLNIPPEELWAVDIKPRVDYYIDSAGNFYVEHESLLPNIDDKILCGVEKYPSSVIKKSCENTLVIKTGYLLIDNEVLFQEVPSIEYITVKSLGNGVAEVEYNNMKKLIQPNETLYDVVPFEMNNKKYTIRLTIRNFGLIRKDSIKDIKALYSSQ